MTDFAKWVPAAALVFFTLTVLMTYRRAPQAAFIAVLLSLAVYPRQLTSTDEPYAGLAQSQATISTFTLAIAAALAVLLFRRQLKVSLAFLPFVIFCCLAAIFLWPWTPYTQSGYVQLLLGISAWMVGASYGRDAARSESQRLLTLRVVSVIVALQLVLSVLQLGGVDLFPLASDIAEIMGSRVHGSVNHPNNLGKVVVLLTALVLPMLDDDSASVRHRTLLTILLAGAVVALTQGRANVLAFGAMILIRVLTLRGAHAVSQRLLVVALAAVGVAPFVPLIADRFAEDPDGGSRSHFLDVASAAFARNPIWGVGPNEYVHTVGQYDAMTSHNLPVHNSYFLSAVDMGAVGAVLFFAPMAFVVVRSWRARNASGYQGQQASSSLALGFGFVVIAATGWGALSGYILPLWMFCLGYLCPASPPGPERWGVKDAMRTVPAPSPHPASDDHEMEKVRS